MMKGKRALSLLLAIVLAIGLLPTSAFAKVMLPTGSDKADGVDMTSGGAVTIQRTKEPLFNGLIKEYRGGKFTNTNMVTGSMGRITKNGKQVVAYCVEHGKTIPSNYKPYSGTADASTKNTTLGGSDNAWLNGVMKAGYPNQSGSDIMTATMLYFLNDPTNPSSSGKFTEKYDDGTELGSGKSLWEYFKAVGATQVTQSGNNEPQLQFSGNIDNLNKYAELATQLAVWHVADQICLGSTLSFSGSGMSSWPDIRNKIQRSDQDGWINPGDTGVPVVFFNGTGDPTIKANMHSDAAKAVLLMATYLLCAGKDAANAASSGKTNFPMIAVDKDAGVTPSTSVSVDLKDNATYSGKKTMKDMDAENGDAGFTVTEGTPYTAGKLRSKDDGVIRSQGLWLQIITDDHDGYLTSSNGKNGDNYGAMYFAVLTDSKPESVSATPKGLNSPTMSQFTKGGSDEHTVIAFVDPYPDMKNYEKKQDSAGKTVNLDYMGNEFWKWAVDGTDPADRHVPKELLIWDDSNADTSHRGELYFPWAKVTKASATHSADQGKLINQFGLTVSDLQDGQEYWLLVGKFLAPDWAQNPGYYYEDFLKSVAGQTSSCDWSGNGKPATDAKLDLNIKSDEEAVYRARSNDNSYQDVIFWGKTPKESKVSVNYKWDGIRFKPPEVETGVLVKLHKTDSASGKSLAGATFSAQPAEGCSNHTGTPYTVTTGADGMAYFTTDASSAPSGTTLIPKTCIVGRTPEGAPIYGPCTHTWTVWESQPPAKYMGTSRTETFTLSDGEIDFGQPNWPNTPIPDPTSFSIMKVDADDPSKVVPGAVFHIKNVDTGDERDYTATTGVLTFHNDQSNKDDRYLPNGSYVVTEKVAPYGYELSNEVLTFNFNDYGTSPSGSLVFADHKKPTLILTKYDANSKYTIPGVTFDYWVNGQHKGVVTTNDLGRIEMTDLETGTYIFQEADVPDGYIKSDEQYSIYVDAASAQKTYTLSIANYAKKSLVITKEDATTGEKLAGAEFEIKCLDNSFVTTATTGSDGTATVTGLDYGTYTITETQAPTGYSLSAKPYTVVLNESTPADTIQVPAFKDNQKHQIKLVKLDANTGEGIPGVTFEYTYNGKDMGETEPTDDAGVTRVSDLETGTYIFQEARVPNGYIKSDKTYSIYIDLDTLTEDKVHLIPVENYAEKTLIIAKVDATTGEKLAGAEFEIKSHDKSFETRAVTDASGTATVTGLRYGTYIITETKAPVGYELTAAPQTVVLDENSPDDVIEVPAFLDDHHHHIKLTKLDANSGKGIPGVIFSYWLNDQYVGDTGPTDNNGVVRVDDLAPGTYTFKESKVPSEYIKSDETFTVHVDTTDRTENKIHEVTVQNYLKKTIVITKEDATTGDKLAGAEFRVQGKTNNVDTTVTTGKDGTAKLTGLDYGTYIITETAAPTGYEVATEPYTLVLNETTTEDVINVPVFKDNQKHQIRLTKLDANSQKPIPGVVFDYWLGNTYLGHTPATDEDGVIVLTDLVSGDYKFKESFVPASHIKSDQEYTLHVDLDDDNPDKIHPITITNYLKKSLVITKEDATTGEKLSGAEFRVQGVDSDFIATVTTGKDGTVTLSGLDYGTYTITETKAPVGYELSAEPQTVVLDATNTTDDVITVPTFQDNQKHTITLTKLDANSGRPIQGVTFDCWIDGKPHGQVGPTDANGQIVMENVDSGTYTFKEATVPGHYIKSDKTYTVEVDLNEPNENKAHTLTINNYLKKTVVLIKEDSTTGKRLAGAEFDIKGVNNDFATTVTTAEDGTVTLEDLNYGTYIITETKAPVGYELSAEPYTLVLDETTTDDVLYIPIFRDNQKHTIVLTKVDANSGKGIAGVTFDYWINGAAHGQVGPTDSDGKIVMENMDSGTYTFKEAKVPSGYIKSDKTYTLEVDLSEANENKTHELTISNYLKKTIVITKEDGTTGEKLAGAEFEVKGVDSDYSATVTTGEDGTGRLEGLTYGTYQITETKPPVGYELSAEPYTLVLDDTTTTDDVIYIPTFFDNQKHTIIITKIDANSHQPIPGVTFDHWIDGKTHEQVGPTDANGQIVMENVDSGTHTFQEAAVPSDYIKSDKTYTVEVDLAEANENKIHELTIENYLKKTIVITKEDSEQGWRLAGARFEVKGVDNDFFDTVETDATGTATVDGMVYGTYTITETRAPAGYEVATEPYTLILNETTTDDVIIVPTFQDNPEPGLMIRKVDSTTKQAIPNVTFRVELLADGGSYTKEYTTDANGLIIIPDVQIGWYRITEVSTPDGYVPSNASKTVQVTATNTPTTVTFENDQLNALNILKLEAQTGLPLAGAVFEIRKASGELVATVTTGANGYATVPNLAPGAYVVTELEAPDHHVIDPKPQTIEISAESAGKTYLLVFRNSDMASLYLRKVDADTNQGVAGAVFKVETSAGTVIAENVVTGEDGLALVDRLVAGTYIVTETQAPDGYLLNAPAQVVAIENGQTKTVTFRDNKPGGIDILKQDAATLTVLPGAEFALYDINDNPIGGPYVTGEDGIAHISGLEPGLYLIKETKAPAGYQCDGQLIKVEVQAFRTTTVTVPNTQKSALTIEKRDKETNVLLEGAVFTVTTQDGTVVAKDLVTGKGGTVTVNDLAEGDYYVTETKAPDGYLLNDTPQLVTMKGDQAAVVTVYDQVMKNLVIRKVDSETNQPLSGAIFELRKQNGTLVGTYTTDSSGAITTQALEPGYYTLVETYAPDGYVAGWVPGAETGSTVAGGSAVTSQTIQIVDGETTVVTIPNTPLPVIEIRKTDAVTGEPLMGAEFTVANEQGNVVGIYTTDSTGSVFTKRLAPGYYTITETKAPDGYLADAEPQRVKLEAGQPAILTFTDQPRTSLLITKVDDATEAPLAGAVFELKAADGSVVGTYTTGENGTVSTAPLEPGNYKLTETTTPDGYMPDSTVYDVTIKAGSANSITIRNKAFPSLTVFKGDSTGKPLPGATIKLETADGDWVAQGVTDAAGEVIFTGLKPGHYIVTETKAPTGYEMVSDPVVTTVEYGKVNRVELVNAQWGGLLIKLTDQADGKALANGQFTVTHCADNTIVFTGTTDTAGTILVGNLIPGHKYIITQTMAPDGYTIVDKEKSEFVAAGENRLVLFEDTTSGIVIEKVDAVTGKTLAGARFQLTRNSDNIVIGEYVTGTDGLALASGLIPGMYTVEELEAPENYTIDEAPKLVHVKANETAHVTFKDTPYAGITLRSIDSVTDKPVAGTVFEVYVQNGELVGRYTTDSTGTVETDVLGPGHYVVKQVYVPDGYEAKADTERVVEVKDGVHVEETFYLVPAGTLTIYALDNSYKGLPGMRATVTKINGEFVANVLTDDTGTASVTGLTPGYYVVTETQAPNGYIIGVAQKNILVSAGAPASVYFTHDKTYGLQILTTVAQTGDPLAGVQYQVTKPNGEIVKTYASDEAGYIYVPLAPGDYVVTPVYVPDGYTVGEGQKITVVNANQYSTVKFVATQLSSVRVQVVDGQTGQGLYGVRLLVKDAAGKVLDECWTDNEGKVVLNKELVNGTYTLEQITVPDGYAMDKVPKTIQILNGQTTEVVWQLFKVAGQIQVELRSADYNSVLDVKQGTLLAGGVFEVVDPVTYQVVATMTSDAYGVAASQGLPLGRYLVRQLSAPDYYATSDQVTEVTLKIPNDVVRVNFVDPSLALSVTIDHKANVAVSAGQMMRVDVLDVSNKSNVALTNSYWTVKVPTDCARISTFYTGSWNQMVWYSVSYKTNMTDYRELAKDLSSTSNNQFDLSSTALGLQAGEYVTDVRFEFPTVPAGFHLTQKGAFMLYILPEVYNNYQVITRMEYGGKYSEAWVSNTSLWTTTVVNPNVPTGSGGPGDPKGGIPNTLPKTGY